MSDMSLADLRGSAPEELERTIGKLRNDLFNLRLKQQTNQLENKSLVGKTRKDIARVMTVISEKSRSATSANGNQE
jgi:large subunit ribosomal protein L29